MNALNTPLAGPDPEVHAALRTEPHRQQQPYAEPYVPAPRARTAAPAAEHPPHPHPSREGDVR